MLLVKTKLGPSSIHGIGLIADQFIPKGTPVWKFQSGFDQRLSEKKVSTLSEPARQQVYKYAYLNKKYVLCADEARFMNHSDHPSCVHVPDDDEGIDVAAWDIQVGEEITCNYKDFDQACDQKLSTPATTNPFGFIVRSPFYITWFTFQQSKFLCGPFWFIVILSLLVTRIEAGMNVSDNETSLTNFIIAALYASVLIFVPYLYRGMMRK